MKLNTFQKVALTTVGATIFLIFVGGLVRVSGAGMGCPDWPKCFGLWIPPTSASDLPASFNSSQFNVFKTWTEYLNRLVGVTIGLLISATFILSFRYVKKERSVVYSSGAAFVLVLVQGWLGGQVVKTGLDEWLITIHTLLAMLIMIILIYATFKASARQLSLSLSPANRKWLIGALSLLLLVTFIQLIMGTQVREAVDLLKNTVSPSPRETWISQIAHTVNIHRSFSWVVLVSGLAVFYLSRWRAKPPLIAKLGTAVLLIIILQILTGIGLYYLSLPPVYQVVHLVGIAFIIALEFTLLLIVTNAQSTNMAE